MGYDGYEISDIAYQLYKNYSEWKGEKDLKIEELYKYVTREREKGTSEEELRTTHDL